MLIEGNLRNTTSAHLHQASPENLGKHTATGVYSACGLLLPGRSKCRGPMALSTERGRRGAGFHATNLYQAGNYEQATSPRSVGGTCHLPGFLCGNCGRDLDGDAYAGCKSFDGFKSRSRFAPTLTATETSQPSWTVRADPPAVAD